MSSEALETNRGVKQKEQQKLGFDLIFEEEIPHGEISLVIEEINNLLDPNEIITLLNYSTSTKINNKRQIDPECEIIRKVKEKIFEIISDPQFSFSNYMSQNNGKKSRRLTHSGTSHSKDEHLWLCIKYDNLDTILITKFNSLKDMLSIEEKCIILTLMGSNNTNIKSMIDEFCNEIEKSNLSISALQTIQKAKYLNYTLRCFVENCIINHDDNFNSPNLELP